MAHAPPGLPARYQLSIFAFAFKLGNCALTLPSLPPAARIIAIGDIAANAAPRMRIHGHGTLLQANAFCFRYVPRQIRFGVYRRGMAKQLSEPLDRIVSPNHNTTHNVVAQIRIRIEDVRLRTAPLESLAICPPDFAESLSRRRSRLPNFEASH